MEHDKSYEDLYALLEKVCRKEKFLLLKKIHITIHPENPLDKSSLCEYYVMQECNKLGDWTEVIIEREENMGLHMVKLNDVEGYHGYAMKFQSMISNSKVQCVIE